jgi:hypothetical protein
MTETQPWNTPCTWEITANGVLIEGWKPFDLPSSSSASSLSSLASTSSDSSCGKKEMKDKETQTHTQPQEQTDENKS